MRDDQVEAFLIERAGELIGSVTDRDIVGMAVADRKDLEKSTVESIILCGFIPFHYQTLPSAFTQPSRHYPFSVTHVVFAGTTKSVGRTDTKL